MQDLIERLEKKATGPDRELDLAILCATTGKPWRWAEGYPDAITWDQYGADAAGNPVCGLEYFTRHLDDAVTLLPDGMFWLIAHGRLRSGEPLGACQIMTPTQQVVASAEAHTAILATCAAALKAKIPVTEREGP